MSETFKPSRRMVTLYYIYLSIVLAPILVAGIIVTWLVQIEAPELAFIPAIIFFLPSLVAAVFVAYWAPKYYDSIIYELTSDEIVVKRGVWWKMKHTVPYSRVMSVDIIQGPISRKLGHATVDVHTAGYTGQAGGTSGPGTRRAEASLIHVTNPEELREKILSRVRTRPLFGQPEETLTELRKIREILTRLAEKLEPANRKT
ncbi:MAG: PH domain-containing protein [Nitrososphaerota archaeon]